jgi:hypothetical protein
LLTAHAADVTVSTVSIVIRHTEKDRERIAQLPRLESDSPYAFYAG